MRLSSLLFCGLLVVGCESKTEGGINATVEFTRVDRGRACIRIAVVDLASVGSQPERFEANNIDISDRELTGEISVGIGRNPEWTDGVEVRASLHRETCARIPEAIDTGRATFRINEVQKIRLSLRQSALDGGSGGGTAGGGAAAGGSAAGGSAAGGSAAGGSAAGGSAAGGSAAGGSAAGGSAAGGSAAGGSVGGGSAAGGSAAGGSAAGGSAAGGSAAG
ncbi:MAG: hypothetical protein Q8L14_35830, partial [Myxococcales bacterium]|nr:hypothetical protein [Myxococcales bacterium]